MCRLYVVSFVDMWDLKAFLKIRPTDIEFESILLPKILELDLLRLNIRVISAGLCLIAIYVPFQLLENFEN